MSLPVVALFGKDVKARNLRTEFEAAALPFAPALYRTARRLARRPEDASDFLQETLLRAYRTFGNFQPGTNVRAWLFTILHSILTNDWRRRKRAPEEVPLEVIEERFSAALRASSADSESALLQRLEPFPAIEAALLDLPEEYREVVVLHRRRGAVVRGSGRSARLSPGDRSISSPPGAKALVRGAP